jgi:DNA processing protein
MVQHYGSAIAALEADPATLTELPGIGPKIVQAWKEGLKLNRWRDQLELADRQGIRIIPYTSPFYPKRLLEIIDHPIVLYVKGDLLKEDQRCLAVIGTRQATIYGLEMAKKISRELSQAGFTIVSGLARGIDTAAHEGALENGRTLAVLGSGLAHIYPQENTNLAQQISHKGALISEFPIFTPPDRQHFPQRNRIVSGMTMGTILVEGPKKSGAMITVDQALSQGRKVFALPGRVDQENFEGNHDLIKRRKAELIERASDILHHFDNLFASYQFEKPLQIKPILESEEENVLRQLPNEELSIEEIVNRTGLQIAKLNVLLMSLVLKKIIKEYPGKIYRKI